MRSSGRGVAPHATSSALAASARSRLESTRVPSRSKTTSRKFGWLLANADGLRLTRLGIVDRQSLGSVLGERRRRFPDGDPHHGEPFLSRLVEDQPRDPFGRRVAVQQEHRLADLLKKSRERIVVTKDHLVVELPVDPALDDPFDVVEVAHHVAAVERAGAYFDLSYGVVAVGVLADAVVVEQAVAVT